MRKHFLLILKLFKMKQLLNISKTSKNYFFLTAFFLWQGVLWAQETKEVDVNLNVDDGGTDWYGQPWIWVVGGAIFIIIIVALMRGGGGKE